MKYLITGGSGFIGLNLVNRLSLDENNSIIIADNLSRGKNDEEFEKIIKKSNVKFISSNLIEQKSWDEIDSDYHYCFHLAAKVGVQNVVSNPYSTLSDNFIMTDLAIKHSKLSKNLKKFIFMSTSEVYAGTVSFSRAKMPTPENTELILPPLDQSRTSYMLSKICGEALVQTSNLNYIIFRPHNIYGPRMGMSHVIPELLKKIYNLRDGEILPVFSPNHTRTFCFIDDAIEMIMSCVNQKNINNLVLNLGNDKPEIKISKLSKLLLKICGQKETISDLGEFKGSPKRRCPDINQLLKITNFKKFTSLEEGLRLTKSWYFSNFINQN